MYVYMHHVCIYADVRKHVRDIYACALSLSLSLSLSHTHTHTLTHTHTTEFGNGKLLELFTSPDIPASNFAPNDWALKVLLGHKTEVSPHFSFPLFPLV
jgi:hypothetical protein